jgi:uncharacterized protein (TIGR02466 family)
MNIKPLFSVPLGITNIGREFTKEEMSLFLAEIKSVVPNIGNVTSFNKRILDVPLLATLKEQLLAEVNDFVQAINPPADNTNIKFYITQSWLNVNNANEWHHPHIHTNSIISGVLYINVDSDVDTISFARKDGLFGNLGYFPKKETDYNVFYNKVPVSNGTVVLFPSTTEHYVDFNKSTHKRISLSFNVFLSGTLGSEDTLSKLDL